MRVCFISLSLRGRVFVWFGVTYYSQEIMGKSLVESLVGGLMAKGQFDRVDLRDRCIFGVHNIAKVYGYKYASFMRLLKQCEPRIYLPKWSGQLPGTPHDNSSAFIPSAYLIVLAHRIIYTNKELSLSDQFYLIKTAIDYCRIKQIRALDLSE